MRILKIREHRELADRAADWFHSKWEVPLKEYEDSIEECLKNQSVIPQWYVALEQEKIIGGIGVIETDFHNRKDLRPNVCALYVERKYRCQGIAGRLLRFVCEDMNTLGIDTLYLITGHTSFYEKYDWEYLCMVQEEAAPEWIRMYIHRFKKG